MIMSITVGVREENVVRRWLVPFKFADFLGENCGTFEHFCSSGSHGRMKGRGFHSAP
jgi:hypothetical protein